MGCKQFNHFKVFFFNYLNNNADLTKLNPNVYNEYKELLHLKNHYDIIGEIDELSNKHVYDYFKHVFNACFYNKLYRTVLNNPKS